MKLDIDKTIRNVGKHNDRIANGEALLGAHVPCLEDAVKVMKMWRRLRDASRDYDMGQAVKLTVHRVLEDIEEEFFPSLITRTLTAKFTISPHLAPCNLNKITRVLESVSDVKVKEIKYDKDC